MQIEHSGEEGAMQPHDAQPMEGVVEFSEKNARKDMDGRRIRALAKEIAVPSPAG